jgi:ABC-type uncharacterized transport system substrate-binding protein
MLRRLKHLWLGLALIAVASGILLWSDFDRRQKQRPAAQRIPRVAVFQFASTALLDDSVRGVVDGLAKEGFVDGQTIKLERFNASGDYATANTIARDLVSSGYDQLITISTPALQVMAAANRDGKTPHVFGAVTDPYGSGVAITGTAPNQHPPHLVGIGTFQPVTAAFAIAQQMCPQLRRVGVVWSPTEHNSEACVQKARAACLAQGLELIEANAGNTSEVPEALRAVLAREVDAIWVGGDTVAVSSIGAIVAIAKASRVPVFTNDPTDVSRGALFSLGASYPEVGGTVAKLSARLLRGADARMIGVENVVPERLALSTGPRDSWKLPWRVPDELRQRSAATQPSLAQPATPPKALSLSKQVSSRLGRPARLALVNLVQNPDLDSAEQGLWRGLRESGLAEGTDYVVQRYNAQGEIAQLPQIFDVALAAQPDLVLTITTPALVAAASKVRTVPHVFTVGSDPVKLGLFSKGRPSNITGVHDDPPMEKLLEMASAHHPGLAVVGTVFNPAEPNSVMSVEKLRAACQRQKITLHEATVANVSELAQATQAVLQRGAQALFTSADNLVNTGFPVFVRTARAAGVPVFTTNPSQMAHGATGACGNDYEAWGAQSGRLAAQVLAGVSPADLPIEVTAVVRTCAPAAPARPWQLRSVAYNETTMTEDCQRGLKDGLARGGLVEGRDFVLRTLNAQGDMTTLSSIMSSVRADQVDLLLVVTTPALQASLRQAGATRIVFTGVGDGVQAGAGKSEKEHLPNVTGVTTRSPFEGMARLLREILPEARRVGTLFTPAELNSVLYKDWLAEALKQVGIELVAVPVTASAETAEATAALCRQPIEAVCQIADNTTRPGFAQIARKAADAKLPVFCFESSQVKSGAVLALARDYFEAGLEAGEMAVRVLRGENPASIPFANTRSEKLTINPAAAARVGLKFPPRVQQSATVLEPGTP